MSLRFVDDFLIGNGEDAPIVTRYWDKYIVTIDNQLLLRITDRTSTPWMSGISPLCERASTVDCPIPHRLPLVVVPVKVDCLVTLIFKCDANELIGRF